MTRKSSIVILALLIPLFGRADVIRVFFAGGQSNAKVAWAEGIHSRLAEEYGPNVVVLHSNHGGTPLRYWYTTYDYNGIAGKQPFYLEDFFNADISNPGIWQAGMDELLAQGHEAYISGFFWFQGESDVAWPTSARDGFYTTDFLLMRDALCQDFATSLLPTALAVVYNAYTSYPDGMASIRSQQIALGENYNDIVALETRDYARDDGVHVNDPWQVGYDMANAFVSIPEPSSGPLLWCFLLVYLLR